MDQLDDEDRPLVSGAPGADEVLLNRESAGDRP
jgi:hypothetical protein